MRRIALVLVGAALLAPQAEAARYAVGVASPADLPALRAALPGTESLAPIPAVVVERATKPRLRDLPGAIYVERLGTRRAAYVPNDALASRQWHLDYNRTFDFWETPTLLPAVRVAVIDSGIDGDHPDFAGKIADAKSFVGGSARVDEEGHGTFVAGLIAAGVNNTVGIAGAASSAELLVAKVVDGNDLIDVEAEVKAIRWAVEHDARVINMSLGGFRDPRDPDRDAFSPLEAQAVGWAHGRGVVIVAAVGNNTDTPPRPWPYASYPAALPHVLGVSALARDGSVPVFSHRDKIYNDIAAPGVGILSTFPRALTAETKDCPEQGYSSCAPDDFRKGQGTSFAAPQVSAAAAVLLAVRPNLRPEQVTELLTRTAHDVNGATGCPGCATQRDPLTGWGRLDVNAALKQLLSAGPPAARPARAERRCRRGRRSPLGQVEPDRGDARLLGRPERRLRDQAQAAPAGLRQRPRACRHGHERDPLAAGDAARRRSRLPPPRRPPVRPARPERVPLVPRARRPGRTTCR